MEITGCVQNGVVVLANGVSLPEGAAVTIVYGEPAPKLARAEPMRVAFPLVRSAQPGSIDLTNDRIADETAFFCLRSRIQAIPGR